MGTFISYYGDMEIQEDKKSEFINRIMKIFQEGGMMRLYPANLFGKQIGLLDKLEFNINGECEFHFNYLNDESRESVYFDKESCKLESGKIGWGTFKQVMLAAYLLFEFYEKNKGIAGVDGAVYGMYNDIGWLNFLFNEKYSNNRISNLWELESFIYLQLKKDFGEWEFTIWEDKLRYMESLVKKGLSNPMSFITLIYIVRGKEGIVPYLKNGEKEELISELYLRRIMNLESDIREYSSCMKEAKEEQFECFVEMICWDKDKKFSCLFNAEEKVNKDFFSDLLTLTPAILLKEICLFFKKDFWDEWKKIKHCIQYDGLWSEFEECRHMPAEKISTFEYLSTSSYHFSSDDFIWLEKNTQHFSSEVLIWFEKLKNRWESYFYEEDSIGNDYLERFIEILYEMNREYKYLFAFRPMFYEFIQNSHKIEFRNFLRLIEETFEECKNMKDFDKGPDVITSDLNYPRNEPRTIMKRLLALLGNKELRIQVFGI